MNNKILSIILLLAISICSWTYAEEMSITEQLAFSTVRINIEYNDGTTGVSTGFFFILKERGDDYVPVIVTNKHVVLNATRGEFFLTVKGPDGMPIMGKTQRVVVENFQDAWVLHPDPSVDLAVMPIAPLVRKAEENGTSLFYLSFKRNMLLSENDYDEINYVEDVLMVGYPIGIQDTVNNMPIFRRGITATYLKNDYEGRKEFVIDAACFPGSSGSPVLLYNVPYYIDKNGETVFESRIRLIGILYGGLQYTAEGEMVTGNIPVTVTPKTTTNIPINLGYVIKAERILDFESLLE